MLAGGAWGWAYITGQHKAHYVSSLHHSPLSRCPLPEAKYNGHKNICHPNPDSQCPEMS